VEAVERLLDAAEDLDAIVLPGISDAQIQDDVCSICAKASARLARIGMRRRRAINPIHRRMTSGMRRQIIVALDQSTYRLKLRKRIGAHDVRRRIGQ